MSHEILERNIAQVIVKKDLATLLDGDTKLRVYLGVDPTGPTIHLGHAIALRKLREFQDLGHTAILLIGDFTAQIGDPTGKTDMRKPLTHEEVLANAESYKKQAEKILDFSSKDNPAEIHFNSDWLSKLSFEDIIKLSAQFTVQQMLERDMFQERMKDEKPIGLHEFLYPLMQGYDTVALKADVELGGTDQTFNMLAGRTLRQKLEGVDKHVLTVPLLVGTDGRKMSKSYHNDIGITEEPNEQFGKIMSMRDDLIIDYFTLCTDFSKTEIDAIQARLEGGENPRDIKIELGKTIVAMYHSAEDAEKAAEEFSRVFAEKKLPTDIPEHALANAEMQLLEMVKQLIPNESNSQIKRLFKEGAIKINQEKHEDFTKKISLEPETIIQIGKRRFFKIV